MRRRDIAYLVGLGLSVLALPVGAAASPTAREMERLYLEGQDRYSAKDFDGAAEAWMRLLEMLPKSEANRAVRENLVVNISFAQLDAVRRQRPTDTLDRLDVAKRLIESYRAELEAVYGPGTRPSAHIEQQAFEIETLRDEEEARLAAEAETSADENTRVGPCLSVRRPGCGRRSGFDTVLLGMLAVPVVTRRRDVLARVAARLPDDVAQRLRASLRERDDD